MHGKVGNINIIIVGGVYPVYPPTPDYIYWEINVEYEQGYSIEIHLAKLGQIAEIEV